MPKPRSVKLRPLRTVRPMPSSSRHLMKSVATPPSMIDRKSTRLNSSHTVIYTLSLHDALPIYAEAALGEVEAVADGAADAVILAPLDEVGRDAALHDRSEEHTSELQSHRDLHSFPTRRSSDLCRSRAR